MAFIKKTIKNRSIEFPSRYKLYDAVTSEIVGEVDLIQTTGAVFEAGTKVDAELLQRYEDTLSSLDITVGNVQPTNGWWYQEL